MESVILGCLSHIFFITMIESIFIVRRVLRNIIQTFYFSFSFSSRSTFSPEASSAFFPRRLTASVSKYSICPLTERNSSAAQAASLSYNSSEIRKGICFFAITVFIKKLAEIKLNKARTFIITRITIPQFLQAFYFSTNSPN